MSLSPILEAADHELLLLLVKAGHRADAVELLREQTGMDYLESARFVDRFAYRHGVSRAAYGIRAAVIAVLALLLGLFLAFS